MFRKLFALLLALVMLSTTFAAADSALPAPKKTIAPFFDLTWEEIDAYGSNAYSMLTKEGYASAWEYHLGMVQINGNMISGAINAEKESYLQFVWQHLGQACVTYFHTYEKLQPNNNGELAAYAFQNDETYLRFSYVSSRYDDYILFVIIRKTAE